MMNQLKRALALVCVVGIGLIGVPSAVAAPAVTIAIETSADAVASGGSVTVTADVDGARADDDVVVGIKDGSGWTELGREPVGDEAGHTFEVTPPVLGRNVFRVGVFRGARLVATSPPAVVTGLIAVDPDPVVAGESVSLLGTLPTPTSRPVILQAKVDDAWKAVDADFSDDDGAVEFTWAPTESTGIRFVAPARSAGGVTYPRFVSPTATVTVAAPEPEPTITRVSDGLGYNSKLSGGGHHLLYSSDPAISAPAVYESGYLREDDPVRTRVVPDAGDPATSSALGLSADGRYVLIQEQFGRSGGTAGTWALYVWDTVTDGIDRLISFPAGSYGAADARISADGSTVAFSSTEDKLLPGDGNKVADAYVIDRDGSHLRRISNGSDGQALPTGGSVYGLSADGTIVIFGTRDALDGDRHPGYDAYRWDAGDGAVQLVTRPEESAELSDYSDVAVSENGRYVGYSVNTGMLVGHSYVWDAQDDTRVEVPLPADDGASKRVARVADLSADGRYVLVSYQTSTGAGVFYRWDTTGHELEQVSGSEFGAGQPTRAVSGSISDDGTVIAFTSNPLDAGPLDRAVFVWSVRP